MRIMLADPSPFTTLKSTLTFDADACAAVPANAPATTSALSARK